MQSCDDKSFMRNVNKLEEILKFFKIDIVQSPDQIKFEFYYRE